MQRHPVRETPYGFRFMGHAGMQSGEFEKAEAQAITAALADCTTMIDVGANIGFFSCLARKLGRHVVAIEPLEQNLEVLYANLSANGWDDVEIFPVGVGPRSGVALMYGGGTAASLVKRWAGMSDALRTTIPLSTLDIIAGDRFAGERLLVKIDVEGSEYDVLQGAAKLLARDPAPAWLVEVCFAENQSGVNPHFRNVFETFWNAGYAARVVGEDRSVTRSDVDRWLAQGTRDFGYVNYMFTK
jgi:FkbM family methyltransferase